MALKSLYCVCEIKKMDLIFSSFSVRSQNHSYKNSIVFRLARHFVLKHIISTISREAFQKKDDFTGLSCWRVFSAVITLVSPAFMPNSKLSVLKVL